VKLYGTEELLNEVSQFTPVETVERIKRYAASQLHSVDSSATIHTTDYFNHSFAPDIVMRWPDREERYVYLRTSKYMDEIAEDVHRVGEHKPVLLSLELPVPASHGVQDASNLDNAAAKTDTLVVSLETVSKLGLPSPGDTVAKLLKTNLARGGRGVVTPKVADILLVTAQNGFEGARNIDGEAVSTALHQVRRLLRPKNANQLDQFYQALWLGVGGSPSQYPSTISLSGSLSDEIWNYILNLPDIRDNDFWRRVGNTLTIGQIGRLNIGNPQNFHNLIKANTESIWARVCQVVDTAYHLWSSTTNIGWRWEVHKGTLALTGPKYTVLFAERVDDLPMAVDIEKGGVAIAELRARAQSRSITNLAGQVEQLEFALNGKNHRDVIGTKILDIMSDVPESELTVTRATTSVDSLQMMLNFPRSTASAVGGAHIQLNAFILGSLPLLRNMTDDEILEVSESVLSKPILLDLLSYLGADGEILVDDDETE